MLKMNNTGTALLPGVYEQPTSTATIGQFSNVTHKYITVYNTTDKTHATLVFTGSDFYYVKFDRSTGWYSILLAQDIERSKAYMAYTKGDTSDIRDRVDMIEEGTFINKPNPSFGFPISDENKLMVVLEYDNIVIQGADKIGKGVYTLRVVNNGTVDGKPAIALTVE